MKVSKRSKAISPSLTRALFNLSKEYDDVVDFTLGDPDIQPDDKIKSGAIEAIKLGKTRYSANAGLIELRDTIRNDVFSEFNINISSTENIIVTVGAMEALYLSLACIVDEGDEVIIPGPYYVNYVQMVISFGGIPIIINSKESNLFEPSIDQIKTKISDKTVAVIINNPVNPTGQVYSKKFLMELENLLFEKQIYIITDEVYKTLIYDDVEYYSVFSSEKIRNKVILIDSISKRFSMTGYRIGFAVGNKEVIKEMIKMQENVAACAPLPSQYAAIEAYRMEKTDKIKNIFYERRNFVYREINSIKGLSAIKPLATFYIFVNISATKMKSLEFAEKLLKEVHVAVAPGIAYGEEYDDYIRISYVVDIPVLEKGLKRIKKFVESLL